MISPLLPSNIDKNSPVPIYVQLKDIIRAAIDDERLAPNERLPSENDLCVEYNISRMTVRQAIRELARDGYVYARRGEGTFVSRPGGAQMLVKLEGFSAQMVKEGHTVRSRTLGIERVESTEAHADAYTGLGERPGTTLVTLERVRYLDNEPFALERSYVAFQNGARLFERPLDDTFSMYRYLTEERGIALTRAEHVIEPLLANETVAAALALPVGSPVLCIRGTTYAATGGPVEYLEGTYRGDRYTFRVAITK